LTVELESGKVVVACANHYRGYGPVKTKNGLAVYINGAPRLYAPCQGNAGDEPILAQGSERSVSLLRELLKEPDIRSWGSRLKGNYCLAAVSARENKLWLIIDLGNSYQMFQGRNKAKIAFSTDIDALARSLAMATLDLVSIADYLTQKSISYPYSFYQGLLECPYASCLTVDTATGNIEIGNYWQPVSCPDRRIARDIRGLAQRLERGILAEAQEILAGRASVGLFLSGGTDSRALAGILAELGIKATAVTFVDDENTELAIARKVAKATGLKHEILFRDIDYFERSLPLFMESEGPHFSFLRGGFVGFKQKILDLGFDAVLGGYMSDSLLKLHEANARVIRFFGRHLGTVKQLDRTDPAKLAGGRQYLRRFEGLIKPELLEQVAGRRRELQQEWGKLRTDGSAWEWSNIWPFMRNKMNPNLTTHIHNFQSFEMFTERTSIEVAVLADQKIKLNGRLFNMAMRRFYRPTRNIPLACTMMPIFPHPAINEWLICLKHLPPRRLMFPAHAENFGNAAATALNKPDFLAMWENSARIRVMRQNYGARLEAPLSALQGGELLDAVLHSCLGSGERSHLLYTLLYLDIWRNNHGG